MLGLPLPGLLSGNYLWGKSLGVAEPTAFVSSLRDRSPVLLVGQCLKILAFCILFTFLVVHRRKVILDLHG